MKKIIQKLLRRNNYPAAKHDIKFAFTSGGVDYYEFSDFNNTPALRGLKTMVFYEEFKMKCTLDFLQLHVEAVDTVLLKKNIDIYAVKRLNDQLKQRLDIAIDTELVYKIASVVFFDKRENIEDYDYAYNAEKIKHWKKHDGADFFLHQPLTELLPILKDMGANLALYSQTVEKLNHLHLGNILQQLPAQRTESLSDKSYLSLVATPRKPKP